MKQIIIDDGTREYSIVNKFGKPICTLHFRPSDISIAERYREMREGFADIVSRAYNMALLGRKGGVIIDFPLDIQQALISKED